MDPKTLYTRYFRYQDLSDDDLKAELNSMSSADRLSFLAHTAANLALYEYLSAATKERIRALKSMITVVEFEVIMTAAPKVAKKLSL